jgi:hypothetical protein
MSETDKTAELLSAEAATIDAEAAALEMTPAEQEQAAAASVPVDYAGHALEIVDTVADLVQAWQPCLGYTPETRKKIADRLAPVMEKHGWTVDLFQGFGPELGLAFVLYPVVIQSIQSVKASKEKQEAIEHGPAASVDIPVFGNQ